MSKKAEYEELKMQIWPDAAFEEWNEKAELERYELAKLLALLKDPATPAIFRKIASIEFEARFKHLAACEKNRALAKNFQAAAAGATE
jgi:hypothetical protein